MATQTKKPHSPQLISLPNSKESEMIVLGCMLTNVNHLNLAANLLQEEDFYFL